jgi:hypothetical protein
MKDVLLCLGKINTQKTDRQSRMLLENTVERH